jgi:hypothetical protein
LLALRQDHGEIVERELAGEHRVGIGLKCLLRLDAADRHCRQRQQEEGDDQQIGQMQQEAD